jgi:hypothetical protein
MSVMPPSDHCGTDGQDFQAWFVDFPVTHRLAGQTVEVVPRGLHDQALARIVGLEMELRRMGIDPAALAIPPIDAIDDQRFPVDEQDRENEEWAAMIRADEARSDEKEQSK